MEMKGISVSGFPCTVLQNRSASSLPEHNKSDSTDGKGGEMRGGEVLPVGMPCLESDSGNAARAAVRRWRSSHAMPSILSRCFSSSAPSPVYL